MRRWRSTAPVDNPETGALAFASPVRLLLPTPTIMDYVTKTEIETKLTKPNQTENRNSRKRQWRLSHLTFDSQGGRSFERDSGHFQALRLGKDDNYHWFVLTIRAFSGNAVGINPSHGYMDLELQDRERCCHMWEHQNWSKKLKRPSSLQGDKSESNSERPIELEKHLSLIIFHDI